MTVRKQKKKKIAFRVSPIYGNAIIMQLNDTEENTSLKILKELEQIERISSEG